MLALGALSAVAGVTYALFQHDLKRLLALHSIENIGIIVLGLGACLVLRARGAETWAAFALGAALLHTLNHAIFKALLFLGAGAFERAVGSLELDRLGGLLRRMPWTGVAFLVGAMAIAGLPPLNGFASEWLTLQALLHVSAYGHVVDGTAGAIALAALAATAALAVFCFVKVVGLVLLGPARRDGGGGGGRVAARDAAGRRLPRGGVRRARPRARRALPAARRARAVAGDGAGRRRPRPARHRVAARPSGSRSRSPRSRALLVRLRGQRSAAPAPSWACGQEVVPRLGGRAPASRSRSASCSRSCCGRGARSRSRTAGGVVQEVSYSGSVPQPIDEHLYRPAERLGLAAARHARRLQSGRLSHYVAYLAALVLVAARGRADRGDRMSARRPSPAGAAQLVGGHRARAAARRPRPARRRRGCRDAAAPAPLQPYRELRRLWGKSTVTVEGTSVVYRLAPAVAAASVGRRRAARPGRRRRARLGRRPRRARARGPARAGAVRGRGRVVGRRQRLLADGREPRPHASPSSSRSA